MHFPSELSCRAALGLPLLLMLVGEHKAVANEYLTTEQAQHVLFPKGAAFEQRVFTLSEEQKDRIEELSAVAVRQSEVSSWLVKNVQGEIEGYFFVDNVIGKHEYITYAVGLSSEGKVLGVEILNYRESVGGEVQDPEWRKQFLNKSSKSPLAIEEDIQNISGATLSCRHVTEGVRRLLVTFEVVLAPSHNAPSLHAAVPPRG